MQVFNLIDAILVNYHIDPKWYPFILIAIILVLLWVLYAIFAYIRSFISWIFGVNEVIRKLEENTHQQKILISLQEQQIEILEALYDGIVYEEVDENQEEIEEYSPHSQTPNTPVVDAEKWTQKYIHNWEPIPTKQEYTKEIWEEDEKVEENFDSEILVPKKKKFWGKN